MGSIGGIAAGCLAEAGRHDVFGCARTPFDNLTLERPGRTVTLPLRVLTDPAAASPADWVLVVTKTQDTAAAAPWLERLCTPATRVAVLQNGIDHVERVAPLAKGATVVPVIVYYNGERLAADRVRMRVAGVHRRSSHGAAAAVSCVLVTTSTQSAGDAAAGSVRTRSGRVTVRPGRSSVSASNGVRAQPTISCRPVSARHAAAMPPMLPRPTTATFWRGPLPVMGPMVGEIARKCHRKCFV